MPNLDPLLATVVDLACTSLRNPDGTDRVLTEVAALAAQRREADQRLRYVVAYAREFVYPRPYKLADLATAAGLSISGIRVLYTPVDLCAIATALHQANPSAIRADIAPPS